MKTLRKFCVMIMLPISLLLIPCGLHADTDRETTGTEIGFDDLFGKTIKVEDILQTPVPEIIKDITETGDSQDQTGEQGFVLQIKPAPTRQEMMKVKMNGVMDKISRGSLSEARMMLQELIETHPAEAGSDYAMFLSSLLEPTAEAMMESLLRLVRDYPVSPWAEAARFRLGDMYFLRREYTNSLNYLVQYVTRNPDGDHGLDARVRIAQCLMRQGEYDKAVVVLKSMILNMESARNSPECYEALSQCFLETNRYDEARQLLNFIIERFPKYEHIPRIYMNLGVIAEMIGKTESAIRLYETVITSFPDSLQHDLARQRLDDLKKPLFSMQDDFGSTPSLHNVTTPVPEQPDPEP